MIVPCMKCAEETDLTLFGVGVGHVFDCDGCGIQLRVVLFGEVHVGTSNVEVVPVQTTSDVGPGAPNKWQPRKG